jgi:hypothetical protein
MTTAAHNLIRATAKLNNKINALSVSQIKDALRMMHDTKRVRSSEESLTVWSALCDAMIDKAGEDAFDSFMDAIGA